MVKEEGSKKTSLLESLVPLFFLVSIGLAFGLGVFWQRSSSLESDSKEKTTENQAKVTGQPQQQVSLSFDQVKALLNEDVVKIGSNSDLILIEVSDPSCPFCSIASGQNAELNKTASNGRFKLVADGGTYVAPVPEMKKLVDAGKATYVYLYAPGHGAGEMGAMAMYCAYEKDKFWEVHDQLASGEGYNLLNNSVKNDRSKAGELADFLSSAIDSSFMKDCLESDKYQGRLEADYQLAQSLGFKGTPYFIINETPFPGAYSFTDMQPVVDEVLKD